MQEKNTPPARPKLSLHTRSRTPARSNGITCFSRTVHTRIGDQDGTRRLASVSKDERLVHEFSTHQLSLRWTPSNRSMASVDEQSEMCWEERAFSYASSQGGGGAEDDLVGPSETPSSFTPAESEEVTPAAPALVPPRLPLASQRNKSGLGWWLLSFLALNLLLARFSFSSSDERGEENDLLTLPEEELPSGLLKEPPMPLLVQG